MRRVADTQTANIAKTFVMRAKTIIGVCAGVIGGKQFGNIVRTCGTPGENTSATFNVIVTDGSGIRTGADIIVHSRCGTTATGTSTEDTNLGFSDV